MKRFLLKVIKYFTIHKLPTIVSMLLRHLGKDFTLLFNSFGRSKNKVINQGFEFDLKYGLDTENSYLPNLKEVAGRNWIYGLKYEACNPFKVNEILKVIEIPYDQFTFIDLGSGKGRALIVASNFPFKAIIGVEYSEQLIEIAKRNFSLYPESNIICRNVSFVCADVADFNIPEGPIVIFLFNPFGAKVMRKVAENIVNSYLGNHRKFVIIYINSEFSYVWKNQKLFKEIPISNNDKIYLLG
jgi:hypothetical protein